MKPSAEVLDALKAVVGPAHCIEQSPDLDPYLADFRGLYRGRTPLVLLPATTDEVSRIVRICAEHGIGIVPHGGNTGYCGGATPDETGGQIVLAFKRLNRIRKVDPLDYSITTEAGCVLAEVQTAAAQVDRLFPLSLGSEGSCQIGGNLSTNAGGTAVLRYGMMRDLTLGLEVVLADGQVIDGLAYPRKNNSGYDLRNLFIGSEGTLCLITAARLKLFPQPVEYATSLTAVPNPAAAVELLAQLRARSGDTVTTFELMPLAAMELTAHHISDVPDALFPTSCQWYALIELTSSQPGSDLDARLQDMLAEASATGLIQDAAIATSLQQREALWRLRESIPEAQRLAGKSIKHDISVPVARIAEFIERATATVQPIVPEGEVIAYGHLGDGNLHFNVQQRKDADAEIFLSRAPAVHETVYDLVSEYHGSFSAEHGIGRLKIPQLLRYKSAPELALMRSLKKALDPKGILNPGKVLPSTEL